MMTIGFSTGALARGDFVQGLRLLEAKHVEAVELSALRSSELPDMLAKLPLYLEKIKGSYSDICWYGPFPIAPLIQVGGSSLSPQASRARRQPR